MVSQVKLIAEPWDVGEGGYQVGNFPPLWSEWNGKYRDCVRDYWRGEPTRRSASSPTRFTGSSDLYEPTGRRPYATINFVTAHDGFTLRDLVSYNEKHNEANGEDNHDGENDNRSWNCGVEGPTDDRERQRAARAPAAQLPRRRCSSRRACRCSAAATRSAARSTATTTPTARTTRSRGSTGSTSTTTLLAFTRAARRSSASDASGLPAPPLVPGPAAARRGRQRHRLVQARRHSR